MIHQSRQDLIIFNQESAKSDAESHVIYYKPDSIEEAVELMSVESINGETTKKNKLGISA
jgi:hypothetical protein